MIARGIYKIKDKYFIDFPDPYLKSNSGENRPCYYCYTASDTGLFWMIPLSWRVEKYKRVMEQRREMNKPCDIVHVARLDNGKESAFLIQDMFPVTDEYILGEYLLGNSFFRVTSDALAKTIARKAKTIMTLIRKGIRLQEKQPNVLEIERKLLENKQARYTPPSER